MEKSIFELADKFGYNSPWEEKWIKERSDDLIRNSNNIRNRDFKKEDSPTSPSSEVISDYDKILELQKNFEIALTLNEMKFSDIKGWNEFKKGGKYYNPFRYYNYLEYEMPNDSKNISSATIKILQKIGRYVFYNTPTGNILYDSVKISISNGLEYNPSDELIRQMLNEAKKVIYITNTDLGGLNVGNFDFCYDGYKCSVLTKIKIEIDKDVTKTIENVKTMLFDALKEYWTESGYAFQLNCNNKITVIPIFIYAQINNSSFHKRLHVQNNVWFTGNRPVVIDDMNITTDNSYYDTNTFAHEYGHVLGLYNEYKSDNIFEQQMWCKDNQFNNDKTALMCGGSQLRDRYFQNYKKTLQKHFPQCKITIAK